MDAEYLRMKAEQHMRKLCVEIPNRRVGSDGNRAATHYFTSVAAAEGFAVQVDTFECIDWAAGGVDLTVDVESFEAYVSPYSLGCEVRAPLVTVATLDELESVDETGLVLLVRGDLAKEQLMPKSFPFYNPEHHQAIIGLLEEKMPAAIIAATTRDEAMVGSQYPFPLFEDGDFDIPSVHMTEEEGTRLAAAAGKHVMLASRARRIPATGESVTARKGRSQVPRVVLFAHIDSRMGTPGANDNASGTATLLVLAQLLSGYSGQLGVEMVAMNGEDYYAASGEILYVANNAGRYGEIRLGINLDDVGYRKGRSAYSLYGCPDELADTVRAAFAPYASIVGGDAWYQGDHMLFVANQVPAVAFTDELLGELMLEVTHTPKDTIDIVDPAKLVTLAEALLDLIFKMDRTLA